VEGEGGGRRRGRGREKGKRGKGRGPAGVQNWDRFLVHPHACRTVLGARWYPHKLPPWGVHGYSSFGWIAVVVSLQDKKGLAPGPEWSLRWAGWLAA